MSERTLVLVKPDGVARGLVGEVIARIERKGLRLVALELRTVARQVAEQHYDEHAEKPFFGDLLEFITSGPVVAAVVEGERAISAFRQLAGGTDPVDKATPGSIRGDFALETQFNLVHGSDSQDSAKREIALWFPQL
ncbi:MAG TPA: nucleoside-diphosphate kinase [Pseudonocardiaceae bacterium]|nr:nucleoside-diphosphate kinase [Pseudonocardiaceae bacterium]